jgi:hypothetical protein
MHYMWCFFRVYELALGTYLKKRKEKEKEKLKTMTFYFKIVLLDFHFKISY